jgi:chromosome segregation ATPase
METPSKDFTRMTTDSTESKRTQLEQRAQQLNEEHAELQRQAQAHRLRLGAIDGLLKAAQRRYDVLGEDDAGAEIPLLRSERITTEATIAELTRQAQEIPARINTIRQELEAIAHRERLRTLAQQRRAELEAYALYESCMLDALDAFQALWNATDAANMTHRTAHNFANAHKLATFPERGALNYPTPNEFWFRGSEAQRKIIRGEFERTRTKLPTVE